MRAASGHVNGGSGVVGAGARYNGVMTTAAPEEDVLTEDWLAHDVPCGIYLPTQTPDGKVIHTSTCGETAVMHCELECSVGWRRWRFLCAQHYADLRNGKMGCLCCQDVVQELRGFKI